MPLDLGRQVKHSKCVDEMRTSASFSQNCEFRYWLHIPYVTERGRSQSVSVILKNPSSADAQMADTTIRRVEEYVHRSFPTAAGLTILNIFAYRATKPKFVNARVQTLGLEGAIGSYNDCAIKSKLFKSHHILIAWGAHSGIGQYDERVQQVAKILYPYRHIAWRVGSLSKNEHPLHGLRWAYNTQRARLPCDWKWWPPEGKEKSHNV